MKYSFCSTFIALWLVACTQAIAGTPAVVELVGPFSPRTARDAYTANFSPDGKRVVTGYRDGTVRIWEIESRMPLLTLPIHTGIVWSAVFSPDGEKIVSASRDGTTIVWDAETGRELKRLDREELPGHCSWDFSANFSPDGKKIVTTGSHGGIRIWDAEQGKALRKLPDAIPIHARQGCRAFFSPDGKKIITTNFLESVQIKPEKMEKYLQEEFSLASNIGQIQISGTGRLSLPIIDEEDILRTIHDNSVRIWDAETGKELNKIEMEGHTRVVRSVDISPDGKKIVSAGNDGTARIWDVESGKELKVLEGHTHLRVNVALFSPDREKILTQSGMTLHLWDVESGKELQKLEMGYYNIDHSTAFSPGGKQVVTANSDGTTRIRNLE